MPARTNLSQSTRTAQMSSARATVREFADNHLMQEVKFADVYHSETPSDFERWQMVGLTSFPIKQKESQKKQQQQQQGQGKKPDFNNNQPDGAAAEAVMLYLNGQRSHPVALVDDRRVRPYGMKEGEGAHYAPDGSEQMTFYNQNGAYLISLDGKSVKDPKANDTRMASLRHVNKKMQSHDGEKVANEKDYKHEGDSVNTEVRVIKNRIEFYAPGDKKVGLYDKGAKRWFFDVDGAGSCTLEMLSDKITLKVGGSNIEITSGRIKLTSPRIDHN